MKIALISHTAYPDFIGGRERHMHNLACGLALTDEVVVIAGGKTEKAQASDIYGYKLITLPMKSITVSHNPLQIYRIIPGLNLVLKQEKPDLVHAFEYGSFSTGIAWMYAKKTKVPFFLTIYGYQLGNWLLRFGKVIYDFLIGRQLLFTAEKIFCPSSVQRQEALDIAQNDQIMDKLLIQPNSIEVNNYTQIKPSAEIRNKFQLNNKISLVCITRILPRKGIKYLIAAMDKIINQNKIQNLKLLIIGPDCGEKNNLQQLVQQAKLEDYIEFCGSLPHEQAREILASCDIFVLPSLYEGLPLSLLEAMAAAKPVIFSNLDCAHGLIIHRKNGMLVPPADKDALAKALIELSADQQLRKDMGRAAQISVRELDFLNEAKITREIYARILENKNKNQ